MPKTRSVFGNGHRSIPLQKRRSAVKAARRYADTETVELKVSGPVKVIAVVLILAGVLGVGAMMFLGPSADSASAGEVGGVQLDAQGRVIAIANKANKRIEAPKNVLRPPSTATKKQAPARAKPRKPVAPNGLPRVVAIALTRHSAVVVALYTPEGKIDPIGFAEAKQGAALARAGFVAINVFDSRTAAPLMTKLGVVLRAPAVLIFKRPGDLATRIDGFADRETVAQAAQNAAS